MKPRNSGAFFMSQLKKISILGCGWFGFPFAKSLLKDCYQINGSTTSVEKLADLAKVGIKPFLIDATAQQFDAEFFDCDLLFVNIPPRKKGDDINRYPQEIKAILDRANGVKNVVFISSTGIYEDGNFIVDETVGPNPNTPAGQKLKLAEEVVSSSQIPNKTIIRFAGLIGKNRNLAKFFAGRTDIENGTAPINLIDLEDAILLCKTIINQEAFGTVYHGVHPNHSTRSDFYTSLCEASKMQKPSFIQQKNSWKQVDSANLQQLNFKFRYPNWEEWILAEANSL